MQNDSFGNRMKAYERNGTSLIAMPLLPLCIRIDGKAFHSYTKGMNRPYDERLRKIFSYVTRKLMEETSAIIGYTQSDEISLILYEENPKSQLIFDGKIYKINSVLASLATYFFQEGCKLFFPERLMSRPAIFDCRAWNVPTCIEAVNYLLWREQDATKNAISMAARVYYYHKELEGKDGKQKQEMLFQKGVNFNDLPDFFKRGIYLQKVSSFRKFTTEELEKLPEKHDARSNPDLQIERKDIVEVSIPPLHKIKNRVSFVFKGHRPITEQE
ncbi:MAG: tRNA(His) guanylyltransferase Thg1 family protein [Candidatus Pacearchaeota archaeon]